VTWSPDGTRIAFIGSTGGVAGNDVPANSLFVGDVSTGGLTEIELSVPIGNGHTARATWTPDSEALMVGTG
jgi:Tol biopolymer transport system component